MFGDPQSCWDSESRKSPFSTVADPDYDGSAEAEWEAAYERGMKMWGQEDLAVEYADATAGS